MKRPWAPSLGVLLLVAAPAATLTNTSAAEINNRFGNYFGVAYGQIYNDSGGTVSNFGYTGVYDYFSNSGLTLNGTSGVFAVIDSAHAANGKFHNKTGGSFSSAGAVLIGDVSLAGGEFHNESGGTVLNTGSLASFTVANGGLVRNYSTFDNTASGTVINKSGGVITNQNDGVFTNNATFTNESVGIVTNYSGGTINNSAGTLTNGGTVNNFGTFDNTASGAVINKSGGTIVNQFSGTFTNSATFTNESVGIIRNDNTFTNASGGELRIDGDFQQTSGATGAFSNAGLLYGSGVIDFFGVNSATNRMLLNSGTINPGSADTPSSAAGTLTLTNLDAPDAASTIPTLVFEDGGILHIELGRLGGFTVNDSLELSTLWDLDLDDSITDMLSVSFLAGSTPLILGDTFDIVTGIATLSGVFDLTDLPTLGAGLAWAPVIYGGSTITLQVQAAEAAVPEPGTYALIGAMIPLCYYARRRQQLEA
jgi:hypothetical protein